MNYLYYIAKVSIKDGVDPVFLGPYASEAARDELCMKLHKETLGKTKVPFTYYRANVKVAEEAKKAA